MERAQQPLQRPNPTLFTRARHSCDYGLERLWRRLRRFRIECSPRDLHHDGTSSRSPYLGCSNRCDRLSHLFRYRGRNGFSSRERAGGRGDHHIFSVDGTDRRDNVLFPGNGS
jgi:hypothetical protein